MGSFWAARRWWKKPWTLSVAPASIQKPASNKQSPGSEDGGYSLPEVMIASTVMALVVTNSVSALTQSSKSFSRSRERDAISTLIAKDLENLRATAFNYMRCDPSPQLGEPAGCPAARVNSFADGQITFVPDKTRCAAGTLAEGLAATNTALASTTSLAIPQSLSGVSLQGVSITRSVSASGNELTVNYSSSSPTTGNSPIYQKALIVPESTGWCP